MVVAPFDDFEQHSLVHLPAAVSKAGMLATSGRIDFVQGNSLGQRIRHINDDVLQQH